jgi:DNA-binding CsgD family transcriptional regulator
MFPQKNPMSAQVDPKTYPLGEEIERIDDGESMALVALSHTPLERRLYAAMLTSVDLSANDSDIFTPRRLMEVTGICSLSTIRRGLEGLVSKFSVERRAKGNGNGERDHSVAYKVFTPEEVMARRDERGIETYARRIKSKVGNRSFERAVRRVLENSNLSRREGQVALCCVEGLTNAEIGSRLLITEQTVKFHLHNIFVKFGVRRRAELISRLLM